MKQSELEKKKTEKLKRMREKQVQNKIQETIHYDPENMKKTISRKTRELRLGGFNLVNLLIIFSNLYANMLF